MHVIQSCTEPVREWYRKNYCFSYEAAGAYSVVDWAALVECGAVDWKMLVECGAVDWAMLQVDC